MLTSMEDETKESSKADRQSMDDSKRPGLVESFVDGLVVKSLFDSGLVLNAMSARISGEL